jgi:hypothetical protein
MSSSESTQEARIAELERTQRAYINYLDRLREDMRVMAASIDTRFSGVMRELAGIKEGQRVQAEMLTELLKRLPPEPPEPGVPLSDE